MQFNDWLKSIGLSESSVLKYYGAIQGPISDWARDSGIISASILNITDQSEMSSVVLKIRKLPVFLERDATGHNMYSSALKKYSKFLFDVYASSRIEDDIQEIISSNETGVTEKTQLINARIGQGKYRTDLVELWKSCAITGYQNTSLLVASHIKPWSRSSNIERLDKFNGLLLLPNLDKAFDRGLISFDNSGKILLSPALGQAEILGIKQEMTLTLRGEHQPYLYYHRENVFIDQ